MHRRDVLTSAAQLVTMALGPMPWLSPLAAEPVDKPSLDSPGDAATVRKSVGPLRVSMRNPRYFEDPSGQVVYLAGMHDGWELQDFAWGDNHREQRFAWTAFLDDLVHYGHNVIRLWMVEHTRLIDGDRDLTEPMPWVRVSSNDKAGDGGDRFDIDQFSDEYFDRLRTRVIDARNRGLYVIVMLFQGWSIEDKGGKVNPWPSHPFHSGNNSNGIDGDADGDGQGRDLHTWLGRDSVITLRQQAYVRKVIDTVNDLPNVLYEIANESHGGSTTWQYRMIQMIHDYESSLPHAHPVGMTFQYPNGTGKALMESPADWISPGRRDADGYDYRNNPRPSDGRKVILSDSDHIDGNKGRDRAWVWKTFCRGCNVLFMDRWTEEPHDPKRIEVRRALGHTVAYSRRMDLSSAVPDEAIASSRFCLACPGEEYLVYQPDPGPVAVDLPATPDRFRVEWFNPLTGETMVAEPMAGGAIRRFTPPFDGDSVLYLLRESNSPS